MAGRENHQSRLQWNHGWNSEPIWPREPEVDVIESLARRYLAKELPRPLDDDLLEVTFFAEGGFNKLYEISYAGHRPSYLLRATLPIVPYYKTESEVATIAYLRANTTIPVPHIFAWKSNGDNELTFEWILMEKMRGIPLYDLWPRQMPWERKLELTQAIAGMIKRMQESKFDRIGGLYFKSALEHGRSKPDEVRESRLSVDDMAMDDRRDVSVENAHLKMDDIAILEVLENKPPDAWSVVDVRSLISDIEHIMDDDPIEIMQSISCGDTGNGTPPDAESFATDSIRTFQRDEIEKHVGSEAKPEFSIGPIFDHLFFVGSRLYLPGNRGPYESSLEWLKADIQVQLEWIKHGASEGNNEYDEQFSEESPTMERLCHEFLGILPTVIEDGEDTSFVLHHSDLNDANILVDPETFEITGIVDWEMINVVPRWRAADPPKFLDYMEPDDVQEPLIPSDEISENDVAWELRDRWEHKTMRCLFDEIINQGVSTDKSKKEKAKRDCHDEIPNLTGMWGWSEMWLKRYKATGISINSVDRAQVTYESDGEA